ncbi:hypothetical protein V6N13_010548 [Hibiscus sabdariffa]|uniref:Uncharacterized protein n=2 Tax=Hibiscus sabdariffa TaxID=183260 RepID=A0ABR2AYQ4_9ROSI
MDSDLQVVKGMSFRTGQLTEWVKWKSLGSGGFGYVYLATVTKPVPRLVAVKYSSSPSPSLQKEYRVLRRFLDCPNIVQCYGEVITIEGGVTNHNLLLEYADRGNLLSLIKKYGGKIPESHVRHYTKLIVEGLCVIHEKGYVHCDIKPQNILVYCSNQSGCLSSLKIADFGLAKEPGERDVDAIVSPYHRGTFNYMSPEAARQNQCCKGYMGAGMYHCGDDDRKTAINGDTQDRPSTFVNVRKRFLDEMLR